MRYGFCRKSGYTKRKLTADLLITLRNMKFRVTGKLVAELLEVVFATLQQALLQRGNVVLPGIGELRIRILDGGPKYFFEPSIEVTRRVHTALDEDEDGDGG